MEIEPGVVQSVPPSEERETEWNDEMDVAGTWPPRGVEVPRRDGGKYGWSTVSESDFFRVGCMGRGRGNVVGLRGNDEEDELETETDFNEP